MPHAHLHDGYLENVLGMVQGCYNMRQGVGLEVI